MLELSLFTGAGGGILGTHLLGWTPIGYVEIDDYCQRVLAQRIKDGLIPNAPIFGDIRTFISDGYAERYRDVAEVVTAGFPCTPFSYAGKQQADSDPNNMWPATRDTIRIVQPAYVLLENVPGLLAGSHGYFGTILGNLAEMGYNARWGVLAATHAGAPHLRERLWVVAYAQGSVRRIAVGKNDRLTYNRKVLPRQWNDARTLFGEDYMDFVSPDTAKRESESGLCLLVDGMADVLGMLRAVGNGQVPPVVRLAWEVLSEGL